MYRDLLHENQRATSLDAVRPRKPYHQPVLEILGDLRTMTLGASPAGVKDSGTALYTRTLVGDSLPGFPPLPGEDAGSGDPYLPPLP